MVIRAGIFGIVAVLGIITIVAILRLYDRSGSLQDHFGVEFVVIEHAPAFGVVAVAVRMSIAIAIHGLENRLGFIVKSESFRTVRALRALGIDSRGGLSGHC